MSHIHDGGVDAQFSKAMFNLAETLGTRITETRIRSYASLLADVPYEDLRVAFVRAAREGQTGFFPSIGELLAHIGPTPTDRGLIAWTALCQAAERVGAWASLEIEDGAAADALLTVFGGWPDFCEMADGPALALRRQEFLAAYRNARRSVAGPRRLTGLCGQPPPELAGRVWAGAVTAGGCVIVRRDAPQLEDHGDGLGRRNRISQGGATEAEEGPRASSGAGRGADGSTAGGGPRRTVPTPAPAGRAVRTVQRSERVGAHDVAPASEDDGSGAGASPHDGREPDAVRPAPRRVRRGSADDRADD